jgi:hypothetical protein
MPAVSSYVRSSFASFMISIDTDPAKDRLDISGRRGSEAGALSLLERLNEAGVPATWGFADLRSSSLAAEVAGTARHELALLADPTWAGPSIGRGGFAAGLASALTLARGAGCSPTTLILGEGPIPEHLDLLVKQGITALRGATSTATVARPGLWSSITRLLSGGNSSSENPARPRSLRWGVWEMAPSISLSGNNLRVLQRAVDRAIGSDEIIHLAIALPQLAGSTAGLGLLERLLRHVSRRRGEGVLETETMAGVVARLSQAHRGRPGRSILRHTAA